MADKVHTYSTNISRIRYFLGMPATKPAKKQCTAYIKSVYHYAYIAYTQASQFPGHLSLMV